MRNVKEWRWLGLGSQYHWPQQHLHQSNIHQAGLKTWEIANFMLENRRDMPLTDNYNHLKQYIALNIEDDTIRVVSDGARIGGVLLWKLTTAERGELGVWDHSLPSGNVLVVHHLVATDKGSLVGWPDTYWADTRRQGRCGANDEGSGTDLAETFWKG